jgi:hypothetical protein
VESPQQLGIFEKEAIVWEQPDAPAARAFYRGILELNLSEGAAGIQAIPTTAPDDIIAYRRDRLLVLVNPRNRPVAFAVQGVDLTGARELVLPGAAPAGEAGLPAYGFRMYQLASDR